MLEANERNEKRRHDVESNREDKMNDEQHQAKGRLSRRETLTWADYRLQDIYNKNNAILEEFRNIRRQVIYADDHKTTDSN